MYLKGLTKNKKVEKKISVINPNETFDNEFCKVIHESIADDIDINNRKRNFFSKVIQKKVYGLK